MEQLHNSDFFPIHDLPIQIIRRDPQPPFPVHTHDFIELVIIYGGHGVHFTVDGGSYPVSAGDVFVVREERAHGYRDMEDLKLINILFLPEVLGSNWADLGSLKGFEPLFTWEPRFRDQHKFENKLRLPPLGLNKALALVESLESELSDGTSPVMVKAAFTLVCGFLARSYSEDPSPSIRDLHTIEPLLGWMEKNLTEPLSLENLCQRAALSESSLLRLFHRVTGHPPLSYHGRLRIRRACEELRHSDKTITQIAFDEGWEDSNYFSRQFKKVLGISPREYRKSIQP